MVRDTISRLPCTRTAYSRSSDTMSGCSCIRPSIAPPLAARLPAACTCAPTCERRLRAKTARAQEHSARSRAQPAYLSRQSDRVQAGQGPQRQPPDSMPSNHNSRRFPAADKRKKIDGLGNATNLGTNKHKVQFATVQCAVQLSLCSNVHVSGAVASSL
jgi:hypothetical protein